jgi:hypothetical protein
MQHKVTASRVCTESLWKGMIRFTSRNSGHIALLGHCQPISQQLHVLDSGITHLLDLSLCNWYVFYQTTNITLHQNLSRAGR